jgi:signal transduction histidine kinase
MEYVSYYFRIFLAALLICSPSVIAFAQSTTSAKPSSQFYNRLAEKYMDSLPMRSLQYAEQAYYLAKSGQDNQAIYRSLSNIVTAHWKLNNREQHKHYSILLLEAYKQLQKSRQSTPWDKMLSLQKEADSIQMQLQKERYNQALAKSEHSNNLLQTWLVFVALFAIVISFFWWRVQRDNVLLKQQQMAIAHQNLQLKEQNERLHQLGIERDELVHMLSHDLRTPFSTIYGLLRLIEIDGPLNSRQQEYVMQMDATIKRANLLIKEVLEASLYEQTDSQTYKAEIITISQVVEQVIKDFKGLAESKNIQIVFNNPTIDWAVYADRQALTRILENLLSNAIKYSPADRQVIVEVKQQQENCHISVQDFGPGFTEDDKKKMFKKFQRLSAKPTAGEPSTGLGLAIVKKLTEQMKGTITCESVQGKGAKFILSLPLTQEEQSTTKAAL